MRAAIAFGLAVAVTGCLDDDDGDPANYVPVAEIGTRYKAAYCTYAARCGFFPDQSTCIAAALTATTLTLGLDVDVLAAIYAGRIYYNGSNVKACFDALAAQTCDKTDRDGRVLGTMPVCRDILRGTIEGGQPCTVDGECISQSCSGGSTGTSCVQGVCIGNTAPVNEPAQLDAPCSPYCADGLYCDFNTNRCARLLPSGSPCLQSTDCDYDLMCIVASGTSMRSCRPAPTLDQPCPDFTCRDEGQFCDSSTTTCRPVGLPPTTCSSSSQCSPYYLCDFTLQQCKKGPTLGMPCSSANRCFDAGTYCNPTTSMCAAVQADGAACNSDVECQSNNCDSTGVCASLMPCL